MNLDEKNYWIFVSYRKMANTFTQFFRVFYQMGNLIKVLQYFTGMNCGFLEIPKGFSTFIFIPIQKYNWYLSIRVYFCQRHGCILNSLMFLLSIFFLNIAILQPLITIFDKKTPTKLCRLLVCKLPERLYS